MDSYTNPYVSPASDPQVELAGIGRIVPRNEGEVAKDRLDLTGRETDLFQLRCRSCRTHSARYLLRPKRLDSAHAICGEPNARVGRSSVAKSDLQPRSHHA